MPPSPQNRSVRRDRKSTRLNSSHVKISYAVFCLKKKKNKIDRKVLYQKTRQSACDSWLDIDTVILVPAAVGDVLTGDIVFFFLNDTATTEIYTLSLHDALPI